MRYAHFAKKIRKMRQSAKYAAIAYSRFSDMPSRQLGVDLIAVTAVIDIRLTMADHAYCI